MTAGAIKEKLLKEIFELKAEGIDELIEKRYNRFRKFGEFEE